MDRGQDRQPDLHRLRPRRLPPRRAGAAQGRQDPRRPDAHRRRPRRVLLRRPAEQVQDRADALGVRLLRHPGRAPDRPRACTPTRRPAASPTAARSGSPRRCSSRSAWCRPPPTTSAWTRPSSGGSTSCATTTSRTARRSASSPTPASTASASTSGWRPSATRTSCKQKEEAKSRAGCSGIGISTMTEPLGAGNSREYDILGIKMFDSAELRVHMTGKAILRTGAKTPGPGPRDDVGADRRPRARHPGRGHRRRGGRHRHRAVRHGHLRLAQHAGRRRGRRDGVPQDPGQGPQARRPPARGVRGGRRVGARPLLRAQRARTAA